MRVGSLSFIHPFIHSPVFSTSCQFVPTARSGETAAFRVSRFAFRREERREKERERERERLERVGVLEIEL